jgi:beta-galactosidase GanA
MGGWWGLTERTLYFWHWIGVRKMKRVLRVPAAVLLAAMSTFAICGIGHAQAAVKQDEIPKLVEKNGNFALMVDGEPYLMLGVQANNSSAWPEYLDKVWPAAETLHANTVELPVYWEQLEAEQGKFDFSVVDLMLKQAREHKLRLVLLWFGTWKNGSSHYTPEWIKTDQLRYPFVKRKDGTTVDSPSTFSPARLEADKTAFARLMRHLKEADPEHTVIMVQVENEVGVWGAVRDYGVPAEKAFAEAVPEKLVKAMGKPAGTWAQVFGEDADEIFQAWCIAVYVEQVAAAGKAEYALPLYVNAALRDPLKPGKPPSYESGAPTDNEIGLWKVAAPSIDLVAPDIYLPEYAKHMKAMELYRRPDNALMIPETGNQAAYARYVFAALGNGAIGWSPFGLDLTRYSNQTEGPAALESSALKPFAQQYALLAPIQRKLAHWSFEGTKIVKGSSEDPENHRQTLEFAKWNAMVSYGMPSFGDWMQPKGNSPADGGVLVVQLFPDEFLVTGHHARVDFKPVEAGKKRLFLKVEEIEPTADGGWKTMRIWNGDQTDYGLNLKADEDVWLRVTLTTF